MGQASVLEFLKKYKNSKKYKEKRWLSVRDIYDRLKNTKEHSEFGPITNSAKKLRETGMINFKEMKTKKSHRKILHYQAK